jgi:DNA repair protein RadC
LASVLSADAGVRASFLGTDRVVAEQLDAVREAMLAAALAHARAAPLFPNTLAAADYLMVTLAGERAEQVRTLYLDRQHMLIRDECVAMGSIGETPIYPREIIRRALEFGAASLILVHNHPSGDLTPSQADIRSTQRMMEAGAIMDVAVLDHLIVSRAGICSLRARGWLS